MKSPRTNLQRKKQEEEEICHVSNATGHQHLSPVTCHLNTTLCSFSCYESPLRLGDVAAGGLVKDGVNFSCKKQKNI